MKFFSDMKEDFIWDAKRCYEAWGGKQGIAARLLVYPCLYYMGVKHDPEILAALTASIILDGYNGLLYGTELRYEIGTRLGFTVREGPKKGMLNIIQDSDNERIK